MHTVCSSTAFANTPDAATVPPWFGSPAEGLAGRVARLAQRALLREVFLTPKPGLVDRRNTGAHRDMDLFTFLASARAIAPWFEVFFARGLADCAMPAEAFLPLIRPGGVACERDMLRATGGVNTHKGSIFAFGLLCAAAGRLAGQHRCLSREALCDEVGLMCAGVLDELQRSAGTSTAAVTSTAAATAAATASATAASATAAVTGAATAAGTAGERLFRRYGLTGARGEAASGFATVRHHALPAFDRLSRDGAGERAALHGALLELLACNPDTNLVARGGLAGLAFMQARALRIRAAGGVRAGGFRERMEAFDDAAIARNLSPGGSADLLAVTWFLSRFPSAAPVCLQP